MDGASIFLRFGGYLNWPGFPSKCNNQLNENLNSMLVNLDCLEGRIRELDSKKQELEDSMKKFEEKIINEINIYRQAIDDEIANRIAIKNQELLTMINTPMFRVADELDRHRQVFGLTNEVDELSLYDQPIKISRSIRSLRKNSKPNLYFNFYCRNGVSGLTLMVQ